MQTSFQRDFGRARWDVKFFARRFLGIELHPGQERMVEAYLARNKSGWRALWLWIMVAAGNRAGKTLALSIVIIHSCVFKLTLEPPADINDEVAVTRWLKLPYHWWHFANEQGPAEQVFSEITTILAGNHPAQKDGCPWAVEAGGAQNIAETDTKERGEYAWVKFNKVLGGAQIHFRSTKQKALGSLGQNMHGVSFDEAGLEPNLDLLVREVLHARRLGTGGPFILISTPSKDTGTDFEDLWLTGDQEDPFRLPRRFAMAMSTRDNIGYGIDQETFDAMIDGMPEDWIAQNIDGQFVQAATVWFNKNSVDAAFDESLPESQEPRKTRVYIQSLDPGLKDKCWSLVFDVLPNRDIVGVAIERQQGKQTTRGIVELGIRVHLSYEQGGESFIQTGVDTTALGGHMFRELLEEKIPVVTVEFGGLSKVKRQMLSDLRSALDEGRIKMPASGWWAEVRKQLRAYKLLDRKMEQDLVMGMAIVVKLLRQSPVRQFQTPTTFDYYDTATEAPRSPLDNINSTSIRAKMRERRERERALALQSAGEVD